MRTLFALLLATTVATPVFAADMARKAPAAAPVQSIVRTWAGFYAGAHLGYGFGRTNSNDMSAFGVTDWEAGWGVNGVFGGIFAGYNYQISNYVLGLEADVSANAARGSVDSTFAGNIRTTVPVDGSVRVRLGYAFDDILLYGTGGLAIAQITNRYDDGVSVDTRTKTRFGWTAGAGVEYAFAPNWTVRGEYRYTAFAGATDVGPATDPFWDYPTKTNLHSLRVGVAYRF